MFLKKNYKSQTQNDKTKWQKKQSLEAWAELRSRLKIKLDFLLSEEIDGNMET